MLSQPKESDTPFPEHLSWFAVVILHDLCISLACEARGISGPKLM